VLFVIQADGACALIAAAIMQPALFVVAIPPQHMGSTSLPLFLSFSPLARMPGYSVLGSGPIK
jgi:hypothetical protein